MIVEFSDETDDPLEPIGLELLAAHVMKAEGLPEDTTVAITLVAADRMADLNETYMGKTGPTDVLSFPLDDLTPGVAPQRLEDGPPLLLGDVFVSPDIVKRNAADSGVGFEDEMALMIVHGILHLLGYDHQEDGEAVVMEERERILLGAAGRSRR